MSTFAVGRRGNAFRPCFTDRWIRRRLCRSQFRLGLLCQGTYQRKYGFQMTGLRGFQTAFKSSDMLCDFGIGAGSLLLDGECCRNRRVRYGRLKSKRRGTYCKYVTGMHTFSTADGDIIQPNTCAGCGAYGDEFVVGVDQAVVDGDPAEPNPNVTAFTAAAHEASGSRDRLDFCSGTPDWNQAVTTDFGGCVHHY